MLKSSLASISLLNNGYSLSKPLNQNQLLIKKSYRLDSRKFLFSIDDDLFLIPEIKYASTILLVFPSYPYNLNLLPPHNFWSSKYSLRNIKFGYTSI